MAVKTDEQKNLKDALSRLSYRQTWTLCVSALRNMRRPGTGDPASTVRFDIGTLQQNLYPLLRQQLAIDGSMKFAPLSDALQYEHGAHVLAFLLWLERSGLAYHLGRSGNANYVDWIRLLPAGLKFFAGSDDASPYAPDWIDRVKRNCAGITDEITSALEDAVACFEHGLNRPAIGLLGVALEAAMIELFDLMSGTYGVPMNPNKPQKAGEYINAIRSGIDARIQSSDAEYKERRASVRRACDFADDLRLRRNQASHPMGASFDDASEVEELFLSMARKLPHLWLLH